MRISVLLFHFFVILLGLIQAAALQPPIEQDEVDSERWSSSLYHGLSTFNLQSNISIPKIEEGLKADIIRIITSAGGIVESLQDIDPKEFQDRLEVALSGAFNELQNEFSEPLPGNKTERYKRQETMVTQAFEKVVDAVVDVCRSWEIPEDTVRADFDKIKPHLIRTLLIIANVVNNHPDLVSLLSSSVIIAIIPEGFILWPILRFFGFSPLGPVKGSIAARAQSFLYGAKVPKGGFFAWLQSLGMKMEGFFRAISKFFWPF